MSLSYIHTKRHYFVFLPYHLTNKIMILRDTIKSSSSSYTIIEFYLWSFHTSLSMCQTNYDLTRQRARRSVTIFSTREARKMNPVEVVDHS